ncbi:sulfotransferase [Thermodesulfobacteriota bacterium]
MDKILLTGTFRSGTSLLTACLNAHSGIFIAWQPFWPFFKACTNKLYGDTVLLPQNQDYPMGIFECTSDEQKEDLQSLFSSFSFEKNDLFLVIEKIKTELSRVELKMNVDLKNFGLAKYLDDIESGPAGDVLSQLFDRLLLYFKRQTPTAILPPGQGMITGVKEVFCEEFIEPFTHFFHPNAFAIHIIRDPRAVLASRNYGKYAEATGSKYPIFFIIRTWKRTVANFILNKNNRHYLMIKYEDLVRKTEMTLNQICMVLGIGFSNDMLDFSKYKDSKGNPWKQNSSFKNTNAITADSIDTWKDVLPSREIEILEYYCRPEMELMGYEVRTEHFSEDRIKNFKEDQSDVRDWLRKFDFSPAAEKRGPLS